jgi:predicted RNase H-like HicB family nuclease
MSRLGSTTTRDATPASSSYRLSGETTPIVFLNIFMSYLLRVLRDVLKQYNTISQTTSFGSDVKEQQMKKVFTAFIEYDEESKLYVGVIPNVVGAHTQAETLDVLQRNLQEVLELCFEENPEIANESLHFIGTQQVEIAL